MPRSKTAWKHAEKLTAKELGGTRVLRGADFAKSNVDVIVDDFPFLRIDAKYRQRWAHHAFVEEIIAKYCKDKGDMPVLVTKTPKMRGAYVTLQLDHFGCLLNILRELRDRKRR